MVSPKSNGSRGWHGRGWVQGSHMDWQSNESDRVERPAVHPDCRRPIKISYVGVSLF